jgi:hypothetical protein
MLACPVTLAWLAFMASGRKKVFATYCYSIMEVDRIGKERRRRWVGGRAWDQ